MIVDGVDIVGPFPDVYQQAAHFSVAHFTRSTNPESAQQFVATLTSTSAIDAYRAAGLTPRFTANPSE
jgi:molybdate transport system substrate-binding protein